MWRDSGNRPSWSGDHGDSTATRSSVRYFRPVRCFLVTPPAVNLGSPVRAWPWSGPGGWEIVNMHTQMRPPGPSYYGGSDPNPWVRGLGFENHSRSVLRDQLGSLERLGTCIWLLVLVCEKIQSNGWTWCFRWCHSGKCSRSSRERRWSCAPDQSVTCCFPLNGWKAFCFVPLGGSGRTFLEATWIPIPGPEKGVSCLEVA